MVTMVWLVYNFSALPLLVDVGNVFAFSDHISAMAVFTYPSEKKTGKESIGIYNESRPAYSSRVHYNI